MVYIRSYTTRIRSFTTVYGVRNGRPGSLYKCFVVEKTLSKCALLQGIENKKGRNFFKLGEGVGLTDKSIPHRWSDLISFVTPPTLKKSEAYDNPKQSRKKIEIRKNSDDLTTLIFTIFFKMMRGCRILFCIGSSFFNEKDDFSQKKPKFSQSGRTRILVHQIA